jgi:CDP-diacylglycerol---glycerol-3-phosphate 3-phosphatidyltransferase
VKYLPFEVKYLPNVLSLTRIVLAPIISFLIIWYPTHLPLAIVLFAIASATDYFDGFFARKYKSATLLGAQLDPFADKVLVLSCFFSLYFIHCIPLWAPLAIASRDTVITILRAVVIAGGNAFVTTKVAKYKTAFQISALMVLLISLLYKKFFIFSAVTYSVVGFTLWTGFSYLRNLSL